MDTLEQYIKDTIKKGYTQEQITSALIKSGHSKGDINKVFNQLSPKKNNLKPLIIIVLFILIVLVSAFFAIRFVSDGNKQSETDNEEMNKESQKEAIPEVKVEDYNWCRLGKEWAAEEVKLEANFYIKGNYSLGSKFLCFASDKDNIEEGYYFSKDNEIIYHGKMSKPPSFVQDRPPSLGLIRIK